MFKIKLRNISRCKWISKVLKSRFIWRCVRSIRTVLDDFWTPLYIEMTSCHLVLLKLSCLPILVFFSVICLVNWNVDIMLWRNNKQRTGLQVISVLNQTKPRVRWFEASLHVHTKWVVVLVVCRETQDLETGGGLWKTIAFHHFYSKFSGQDFPSSPEF